MGGHGGGDHVGQHQPGGPHRAPRNDECGTSCWWRASDITPWAYGIIAGARLALAYVVCHLIGRAYGRDVLVWFGRYLGASAKQIQDLLQLFHRAEWVVIPFFVGSNIVAAITGISKVPARRLVPLVTIGIVWATAAVVVGRPDRRRPGRRRARTSSIAISGRR
jgi:hypothetical protein